MSEDLDAFARKREAETEILITEESTRVSLADDDFLRLDPPNWLNDKI